MAINTYEKKGKLLYEVYLNSVDLNGKRYQVRRNGFTSLRLAQACEFELKRAIADKKTNPSYTWSEWHKICVGRMKLELTASTIMQYDGRLKKWVHPMWETRLMASLTPTDVHELIFANLGGLSDNSRRTVLKLVSKIFQMAVDEGVIAKNPTSSIKVKVAQPKQAVLNATEVNILLQEAKATGHRFYEIWAVAVFTGMRSGELYALKWSDVDFENRRISVTRSWSSKSGFHSPKSGKNRVVPISQELEGLLKRLKLKSLPEGDFVLHHLTEWKTGEQARVLRDFCSVIGITEVKFHDLRATFITHLLLRGVPLAQVMAIVGHSQLKTTNVYLRVVGSDLDGATDKLNFSLPQEKLAEVINLMKKT